MQATLTKVCVFGGERVEDNSVSNDVYMLSTTDLTWEKVVFVAVTFKGLL